MPEILDLEEEQEETAAPAEEVTAEVEAEAEAPVVEKPAESPADQPAAQKTSPAKPEPIQTAKDLPYDWGKCIVTMSLTYLPDDGDVRGRPVAVGLRTHEDVPSMRILRESDFADWPQQVQQMFEDLKLMLPLRGEEAAARKAEEEKKAAELKKKTMERAKSAKTTPSAKPVKTTVQAEKPAPVIKSKKSSSSLLPADQPDLFAMFQ